MTQPTAFRLGWPAKSALVAAVAFGLAVWFFALSRRESARSVARTPSSAGREAARASLGPPQTQTRIASSAPVAATPSGTAAGPRRDRQQREAVRKAVYERLGQALPAPGVRASPRASAGRLSKDYIQARIRSDFVPLAKQCYESLLVSQPQARGKAVVSFEIVGDASVGGIVESAELSEGSTLTEPEFETCMRESLLSVTFEPPAEGGRVTITYPFEFTPD